ncbi:hypothetical protein CC79DRAFT_1317162 [Sarocladium strictum]
MDEYSASSSASRQDPNDTEHEPLMCYNHITRTISRYHPEHRAWRPVSEESAAALRINPEELPQWRVNGNTCSPDDNHAGTTRPVADESDKTPGSATWPRETGESSIPASALRDVDQNEQVVQVGRVSSGNPVSVEAKDKSPTVSRSSSASITFSTPETERSFRCTLRRSNAIRMPRCGSPHPNKLSPRPYHPTSKRRSRSARNNAEKDHSSRRGNGRELSARVELELILSCFKLLERVKLEEIFQDDAPMPQCPEMPELGFREKIGERIKMTYQSLKGRVCRDKDDKDGHDGEFGAPLCRM